MSQYARVAVCCLLVAAVTNCAAPQTVRPTASTTVIAVEQRRQSLFVLENRAAEYRRVYNIADRLTRANADLCARQTRTIGVRVENLYDYGRDFRDAAQTLWGLNQTPTVLWVGAGSPAANAGIMEGDRIVAVNGRSIQLNRQASRLAGAAIRDAADLGDVELTLNRGGNLLTVRVTPAADCGYDFQMVDDDSLNAAADGRTIYLTRGMLRFVRTDEELALILSHELAHNAMRHIEAQLQNSMVGTTTGLILDLLAASAGVNTGGAFTDAGSDIGRLMFSQEFESEADYVGLYFMARAGFSIEGAENFWRRMAAESPRGIRFAYTHPTTAERFVGLEAASAEIALKVSSGEELRPNMRNPQSTQAPTSYGEGPNVVAFQQAQTFVYRCPSSRVLRIEFEQDRATVHETRRPRIRLRREAAETGFRYVDGSYVLSGTPDQIQFAVGSASPMVCSRYTW